MNVDKDECRFEWHRILFSDSMLCGALCHPDKVFVFFNVANEHLIPFLEEGHTTSQFPDQGVNPGHSSLKHSILTTRPPENSQQ